MATPRAARPSTQQTSKGPSRGIAPARKRLAWVVIPLHVADFRREGDVAGDPPEAGPDGQAGDVPLPLAISVPSESVSCDSATYSRQDMPSLALRVCIITQLFLT